MTAFSDELRRLRKQSGLSQELLAANAGLSPEAVSLLERGRRTPRLTTLRLLADGMHLAHPDREAFYATAQLTAPGAAQLPTYADQPFGRNAEIASVSELIEGPDTRLITLLGPAGVGKTRIAAASAATVAGHFQAGVHWLSVGPESAVPDLLATVASAIGLQGWPDVSPGQIAEHLQDQSFLLIIDNAHDELSACVDLCRILLAIPTRLTIVVTSRQLTEVPGEVVVTVPPLSLPKTGSSARELPLAAASRLFLTRAGLGGLNDADAEAVVRICGRLDGLPRALELAAARTAVLTVQELADALDTELNILHSSRLGDDPELADATLGLSDALPIDRERLVFERLAVFADRFTCEAVTTVCGAGLTEVEVLDLLTALVAKSLIVRHDDGSPPALFRLLHSVRRYADERFAGHPDQESVRHRHAQYWCELAQREAPPLDGPDRSDWLTLVDRQIANITQAIEWSIEHSPELALRTIAAIGRWCYVRKHYSEARAWSRRALQASNHAPDAVEVFVLELAGTCAFLQNDFEDAESIIRAVRDLFEGIGHQEGLIRTTGQLGAIARERGRYEEAESWHRQALQLSEGARDDREVATQLNQLSLVDRLRGGPPLAQSISRKAIDKMRIVRDREGLIWSLISLGMAAHGRGDLEVADQLLHHCLDLAEELSFHQGVAWATNQLGVSSRLGQDLAAAKAWQQLSLTEHRQLGDRWRQASVYDELAAVAVAEDDRAEAARYLALADGLRSGLGAPGPVIEVGQRGDNRDAADEALGVDYGTADLSGGRRPPEPERRGAPVRLLY